jgi:hypothetical protein
MSRRKSAITRTRNDKFTSVFSTLEPNPVFKGTLTAIADKVIHRGEVISDLKKRRSSMTRPKTSLNPRVNHGSKIYDTLIKEQEPEIKEPIIAFDILSEHTKFLNHILANKLLFTSIQKKVTGGSNFTSLLPSPRTALALSALHPPQPRIKRKILEKPEPNTETPLVEPISVTLPGGKTKAIMRAIFMEVFSKACIMMLK